MALVVWGEFEWDDAKAAENLAKHGVSFEEAATGFGDEYGASVPDETHSGD
ncbi:MAG: BrnT family toxin [Chloroflexota bacterium]